VAEVPDGELAALLGRVEGQLRAGVEPARLAFLIEAAGEDTACVEAPITNAFGRGRRSLQPRQRGSVR
jgi:hypothetical protein